jgi:hypothetical protein
MLVGLHAVHTRLRWNGVALIAHEVVNHCNRQVGPVERHPWRRSAVVGGCRRLCVVANNTASVSTCYTTRCVQVHARG